MGWFSDEEEVFVSASNSKLIDEYPNLIVEAIIFAIVNSGSIVDNILAAYRRNYYSKVESLVKYAKRTDPNNRYYYGMPTGTLGGYSVDDASLLRAIATEQNVDESKINVISSYLGQPSAQGIVDAYLQQAFPGLYFPSSRDSQITLFTEYGSKFYYHSLKTFYTMDYVTGISTLSGIKIVYATNLGYGQTCTGGEFGDPKCTWGIRERFKEFTLGIPISGSWYTAYYLDPTNINRTKVFVYNTHSNTGVMLLCPTYSWICVPTIAWYLPARYPDLKIPIKTSTTFYPVIPLRKQFRFISSYNNAMSASVKKALNYLDLELSILEEALRKNPDIGNLSDAFINFRVPINTQEQDSIEYLYKFFVWAKDNLPKQFTYLGFNQFGAESTSKLNIKEDLMDYELSFKSIEELDEEGNIGKIGSYANTVETLEIPNPDWETCSGGDEYNEGIFCSKFITVKYVSLKKQITSNKIHAYRVFNLQGVSRISFEGDTYGAHLEADIPVMEFLINEFDNLEKSLILLDATQMTVYAAKEETTKWYKTGFWSFVFQVVAIVIAAFTFNPAAVGWAFAAQVVSTAVVIAGVMGLDLGILGTIISIISMGINIAVVGFTGVITKLSSSMMNFAETLMKAVSALSKMSVKNTQTEMRELATESEEFQEEYEARIEIIEGEKEALNDDFDYYNPMWSVGEDATGSSEDGIFFDSTETPSQFFNRTIHTQNPGVRTLDEPSNFISNMLRLPEFNYNDSIPAYRDPESVYA